MLVETPHRFARRAAEIHATASGPEAAARLSRTHRAPTGSVDSASPAAIFESVPGFIFSPYQNGISGWPIPSA